MDYIINNLAQSLVILGLILLAIEVIVLGFSTFVLFFVGLASIFTGILIGIGALESDIFDASLAVGVLSALIAAVSWKPFKLLQNNVGNTQTTNDMIGNKFTLSDDLSPGHSVTCHYSGIDWQVSSDDTIMLGFEVEITHVSVGKLRVKQVS